MASGTKRVVLLTPYYEPVKGGITSFVSGLAAALRDKGVEVSVITREGAPAEDVVVIQKGAVGFGLAARKVLRDIGPTALHCHSHWYTLLPGVLRGRASTVFTFHTMPQERMSPTKGRLFSRLLNGCNTVTFVSSALKDQVTGELDIRTKKRVIRAGVSPKESEPEAVARFRHENGLDGKGPVMLFVGNLTWEGKVEGLKRFIPALPKLNDAHPGWRLLVAGDGRYRGELEALAVKHGIGDRALFLGELEDTALPLAACDLYVHPSMQEGLPISILEAMVLGKPVLATPVGGVPELIHHMENGYLAEPEEGNFAAALTGLLGDDALMRRLGENAKEYVQEHHSWDRVADAFIELYG